MSDAVLNKEELFTLEWLAKEDASHYGECRGAALDRLLALGFAAMNPVPPQGADYAVVWATDQGLRALGRPA